MSVRVCKMKVDFVNDGLQRALARVNARYIMVATEGKALAHIQIALILEKGRQHTFLVSVLGLLCQHREDLHT